MTTRTRQVLAVLAFSAVVAAGITGATLRGETKETSAAGACATAHWPQIPSACLEGAPDREVRLVSVEEVTANQQVAYASVAERFAVAFQ